MLDHLPRLEDIPLASVRVLVRVDLDLAVDANGNVTDNERLQRILPTLKHVVEGGARLILAAHRGDPRGKSRPNATMEPIGVELAKLTGWEVLLPDGPANDAALKVVTELRGGQVCLLENLRFDPGEDRVDESFARALAKLADVYVLDSLSLVDRELASIVTLPRLVKERTVGLELRADLEVIERLRSGERPAIALLGGRRLSEQLELFELLLDRVDALCLGGGVAHTFLAAAGVDLGTTRVETDMLAQARSLLERADRARVEVLLPTDAVVAVKPGAPARELAPIDRVPADRVVVDLGPQTVARYLERCTSARSVIASGPMGLPGAERHTPGERDLYAALAKSPALTALIGGTAAAVAHHLERDEAGRTGFDLVAPVAEPVWRLLRGARLAGLQALR